MKDDILYYSPEALRDLDDIWEYIVMELCNIDAAENVVNGILSSLDKLEDFPEMGTLVSAIADIESDYRFIISGNYMAFYRYTDSAVYIDRILYSKRDYLRILFEGIPNQFK